MQFYPEALTTEAISAIATNKICYSKCPNVCWGPGDHACDYILLTGDFHPWASDGYVWTRDDPNLQGHVFTSPNMSYIGWYYATAHANNVWTNLVRMNNNLENCAYGAGILCMYHNSDGNFIEIYQSTQYGCSNPDDKALTVSILNH